MSWAKLAETIVGPGERYPEGKVPATLGAIRWEYLRADPMDPSATVAFLIRMDKLQVLR